jgi:hypothetical protein
MERQAAERHFGVDPPRLHVLRHAPVGRRGVDHRVREGTLEKLRERGVALDHAARPGAHQIGQAGGEHDLVAQPLFAVNEHAR